MNDRKPLLRDASGAGLLLSFLCALITLGVLQAGYPFFVVPGEYHIGMSETDEVRMALVHQTEIVDRKNAMTIFAVGGALLGASLALIAGGCCTSPVRGFIGLAWGAFWGLMTGAVGAYAQSIIVPRGSFPSVTNTGLSQAVTFGLFAAGLGLMVGGFRKNATSVLTNALTAALAGGIGGLLVSIISGFVADSQNSSQLIPPGPISQFLWLTIPFSAIGFSLSRGMTPATAESIELVNPADTL